MSQACWHRPPPSSTQGDYSQTTWMFWSYADWNLRLTKNGTHLSFCQLDIWNWKKFSFDSWAEKNFLQINLRVHACVCLCECMCVCVYTCVCACMHTYEHRSVFGSIAAINPDVYITKLLWWFLLPTRYEERTWRIQWSIVALTLYLQLCHSLPIGIFVCWMEDSDSRVPVAAPRTERAPSCLWTGPVFCESRECGPPVEMTMSALSVNYLL